MNNPPHSKKKWKGTQNQSSPDNPRPNPQGNAPNFANQKQGTQPKQDRLVCTNKIYSGCGVYGHYTHDCPLLTQMRQLWETQAAS